MMGDSNKVVRTLVLVGRTGNGKSATGNTILGRKAFKSQNSSGGVTKGCELQTVQKDGQIINVIDTPGLFDSSISIEYVGKEILKCIDLAKDGIHAILVVFSVKTRFSEEEAAILDSLRTLFGKEIIKYMIVVYTGGDDLEEDETLQDYIGRGCPQPLKDILTLCGNRMVLFDNKTRDQSKKKVQVQELISLVNMVVNQNDGKPYTNEMFDDMRTREDVVRGLNKKQDISKLQEQMQQHYENLLQKVTNMVEDKLKAIINGLEKRLAEMESSKKEEIDKLNKALDKAQKDLEEVRKKGKCIPIRIPIPVPTPVSIPEFLTSIFKRK